MTSETDKTAPATGQHLELIAHFVAVIAVASFLVGVLTAGAGYAAYKYFFDKYDPRLCVVSESELRTTRRLVDEYLSSVEGMRKYVKDRSEVEKSSVALFHEIAVSEIINRKREKDKLANISDKKNDLRFSEDEFRKDLRSLTKETLPTGWFDETSLDLLRHLHRLSDRCHSS